MRSKSIQIVLLLLLLFSQVADAFACQSMSCMEKTDAIMLADDLPMNAHAGHAMSSESMSDDQSAMCECCQQQCSCPPSIITVGIITDNPLVKSLALLSFQQAELTTSVASAILNHPQRPPKPLSL
ncbi:DUF3619 family protein [Glaciecola sp. SC05]|uniref:DUF3619 family protein n=1 Tax=Glaciecola sp. SC05 TaxID=1987355 RepID=UPI00352970E5